MNYHNITYPDMNNGDGLRVVLWLSGCSHHCQGCQNPQTWSKDSGIEFDEDAKKEVLNELSKDYISGTTFSGGDPLNENNLDGVLDLIQEIRLAFPDKTIWLYTGFVWEEIWNPPPIIYVSDHDDIEWGKRQDIVRSVDVLVDGRYEEDKRDITLKWRGSSNQRVIDCKQSLAQNKIILHCD